MDVKKLGPGQRIAAGAAVLLFIDLFLDWYSASAGGFSVSANAWDAFGGTDFLLAAVCILALVMAAQAMGLLSLPVKLSDVLFPFAAVMALWVLYRLLNQPGPNDVLSNEFGAYLGFILTAAVAYGAMRARGEHEDVNAPGNYKVGSNTMSSSPGTTAAPPAADPAPPPPPPAATTPPADDRPPPPATTP